MMRYIKAFFLTLSLFGAVAAQGEQAPLTDKPFAYKDWTYKNIRGGGETNLRDFSRGKKLLMVVHWAPWCHNWRNDLAFVQSLHEKYSSAGLGIIGVGLYDPLSSMKNHLEHFKLTFPSVYETEKRDARLNSTHYTQRTEAGDTRKWGTPWYVFLDPATMKPEGEFLTDQTSVVNGELIDPDIEVYVQKKLGITAVGVSLGGKKEIEACEPAKTAEFKKP